MTRWSKLQGNRRQLAHWIGSEAESRACQYLEKQGLVLLQRNYRCKAGEIDLIMQDTEHLVFVEVKYRKKTHYGRAVEYFTETKRKKVQRAILHYLQRAGLNDALTPQRIDVIAIDNDQIKWLKAV